MPQDREKMGWVTGLEPATSGSTIRRSTPELHPPQRQTGNLPDLLLWWLPIVHFDEPPAFDRHASEEKVSGALGLRLVHQLIGALNEVRREAARNEPPFRDAP